MQNRNSYPVEEKNCGDDYIMFLPYDGHVCDNVITENTDLIINKSNEIMYSVLSSLHIGGKKYRI